MHILITGGTGFIGSHLCPLLLAENHQLTLITRQPQQVFTRYNGRVRALRRLADLTVTDHFDVIINLAGASLLDRPWSPQRKLELHTSRVNFTEELVDWLARVQHRPTVLLSGSAIGWYGNQHDTLLDEDSFYHEDFLHQLCQDWEKAARAAEKLGIRVCILRSGLVLAHDGGALRTLAPLFSLNLGGRIGDGRQWLSWIGMQDYLAAVLFLMNSHHSKGIFNLTSPQPVTNAVFAETLAHCLHRKAIVPIPALFVRLLMGEMSMVVLHSQRVLPSRLLHAGFSFRTPALAKALKLALRLDH